MKVIKEDIWFCQFCMVTLLGDSTAIPEEFICCDGTTSLKTYIESCVDALPPHTVSDFNSETEEGILTVTTIPCDCCGTVRLGPRYKFAELGE